MRFSTNGSVQHPGGRWLYRRHWVRTFFLFFLGLALVLLPFPLSLHFQPPFVSSATACTTPTPLVQRCLALAAFFFLRFRDMHRFPFFPALGFRVCSMVSKLQPQRATLATNGLRRNQRPHPRLLQPQQVRKEKKKRMEEKH